jgi:hypothetical protein
MKEDGEMQSLMLSVSKPVERAESPVGLRDKGWGH